MQINIGEKNKNRLYLIFSVIFVTISIGLIAWIDRQEVDKKIAKQAELICGQKNTEQKNNNGIQEMPKIPNGNVSDPGAQINTKNEAETSLKNVDDLINSVGADNSAAQ
jgi:hypothetical protein